MLVSSIWPVEITARDCTSAPSGTVPEAFTESNAWLSGLSADLAGMLAADDPAASVVALSAEEPQAATVTPRTTRSGTAAQRRTARPGVIGVLIGTTTRCGR